MLSAFQVPKLRYDPIRKIFFQQDSAQSLHGSAEASCLLTVLPAVLALPGEEMPVHTSVGRTASVRQE